MISLSYSSAILGLPSFTIIFFYSESCILTLLIVSFIVQKLLNLIRSNLFIFVLISYYFKRWVIKELAVIYVKEYSAYVFF